VHGISEIAAVLARVRDPELIAAFLRSLLTRRELQEVSGRWELVKRLARGDSQRAIARQLGMSLCKITRGSRELKKKNSAFRRVLSVHAHAASAKED
jgi:TrpR family trp operon transcriptional repressor